MCRSKKMTNVLEIDSLSKTYRNRNGKSVFRCRIRTEEEDSTVEMRIGSQDKS